MSRVRVPSTCVRLITVYHIKVPIKRWATVKTHLRIYIETIRKRTMDEKETELAEIQKSHANLLQRDREQNLWIQQYLKSHHPNFFLRVCNQGTLGEN